MAEFQSYKVPPYLHQCTSTTKSPQLSFHLPKQPASMANTFLSLSLPLSFPLSPTLSSLSLFLLLFLSFSLSPLPTLSLPVLLCSPPSFPSLLFSQCLSSSLFFLSPPLPPNPLLLSSLVFLLFSHSLSCPLLSSFPSLLFVSPQSSSLSSLISSSTYLSLISPLNHFSPL